MTIEEVREQIQQDILTRFDYLQDGELDLLCQIVIDNFAKLSK